MVPSVHGQGWGDITEPWGLEFLSLAEKKLTVPTSTPGLHA